MEGDASPVVPKGDDRRRSSSKVSEDDGPKSGSRRLEEDASPTAPKGDDRRSSSKFNEDDGPKSGSKRLETDAVEDGPPPKRRDPLFVDEPERGPRGELALETSDELLAARMAANSA